MRKFTSGLSHNYVLECKVALINNDVDIPRLVVYMQKVQD